MNCEGWSSGATKMGWVVQIKQPAAMTRWVSDLGMWQLMAAWVLGSKKGLSRVGMGSSATAWVASWVSHFLYLTNPFLFFSFLVSFFPSFMAFPFGFWVLLTTGFSSSSFLHFESYWLQGFLLLLFYIYFFKVFIGS